MKQIIILISIIFGFYPTSNAQSVVSIFAGGGSSLGDGGPATAAMVGSTQGICSDGAGNIYFMDVAYQRVRKVTPTGIISTVAGNGSAGYSGDGGSATAAQLNAYGLGCDLAGNLFIGDWNNNRVRKVNATTGIITTIAGNGSGTTSGDGGPATAAGINRPIDAHVDLAGNIYISEYSGNKVRRVDATTGIITTIGDMGYPCQLTVDVSGNVFIAQQTGYVRKISTTGIMTIIAGGGSGTGSGIPATATSLAGPEGVTVDCNGNIFIADNDHSLIRKIDASGIITNIAGGGTSSVTYSGIPATSANFHNELITLDYAGNAYVSDDGSSYIYKISNVSPPPTGFTTVPGQNVCIGGITSFGVTGGTWSSASPSVAIIGSYTGIVTGISTGTSAITCTTTGCAPTITSVTVNPFCTGTPVPGTATAISAATCGNPDTLRVTGNSNGCGINYQWQSSNNNVVWNSISGATSSDYAYYSPYTSLYYRCAVTCSGSGITMYSSPVYIPAVAGAGLHTVSNPPDTVCNGADFYLSVCGTPVTSFNVTTWYGDGTWDNNLLTTTGIRHANILHNYAFPGTYSIRQILYDGTMAVDSTTFSYEYHYCSTLPVRFYFDANNDCMFDSGDVSLSVPIAIEVDSNGVAIDHISASSGFYYESKGGPGSVYSFKVLDDTSWITCPSSGIIYDTIVSYVNTYPIKYIGLKVSPLAHFNLAINAVVPVTGVNDQWGHIYVQNITGLPVPSTVMLTFDPLWHITTESHPMPMLSGDTATWVLPTLTPGSTTPYDIYYVLRDYTPFTIGTTVLGNFSASPVIGDINPLNNDEIRNDTIKGGCDPNFMENSPSFCLSDTGISTIQYTIHFENTGNDTAYNIHIMDTLSANVDAHTLNLLMASTNMNIAQFSTGDYNIVKFDFPNINLLDSSHHGACDGAVIFTVNTLPGLSYGSTIDNKAGIYFDYNAVVMTNTVENIYGCPISLSTGQPPLKNIEIYPNPVNDMLTIQSSNQVISQLTIINLMGQPVYTHKYNTESVQVNVAGLPGGIYFIKINGSEVRRFVRE